MFKLGLVRLVTKAPGCSKLGRRRSVLRMVGGDPHGFLQNYFTNDVRTLASGGVKGAGIYGAFLNSKGRALFDGFIVQPPSGMPNGDCLLLDVDSRVSEDAQEHIEEYNIRDDILVEDVSERVEISILAEPGADYRAGEKKFTVMDTRVPSLGLQREYTWLEGPSATAGADAEKSVAAYREFMFENGLGEGSDVFVSGKTLPFEANLDFLNGVSFTKGCYLGQELTHRAHMLLVTRKRLLPIELGTESCTANEAPWAPGLQLETHEGHAAGTIVDVQSTFGVALVRLRCLSPATRSAPLLVAHKGGPEVGVTARIPSWWPEPEVEKIFKNSAQKSR